MSLDKAIQHGKEKESLIAGVNLSILLAVTTVQTPTWLKVVYTTVPRQSNKQTQKSKKLKASIK